ncbi:MAG TPA: DNA repair protein RadA [Acidobacteriota bacterium]|nr:DNA repair protein RadA [Acidobacteriota bacterium]
MKTARTFYVCGGCGSVFSRWMGRCPDCGAWNSLQEEKEPTRPHRPGTGSRRGSPSPTVTPLAEVSSSAAGVIAAGIGEFDTVLGGGAVPGSTVLIGGEPGIGKSTLLLQVAGRFAQRGIGTLYVSGEESAAQIKLRADRLGIRSNIGLLTETDLTVILAALDKAAPRVLILDSIQTTFDPELQSTPGTVSQVRECAVAIGSWARAHDAVAIMIGHVTKDGFIAGPKVLEHLVDTVLQFEGDRRQWIRILRCLKNRFGSTHEVGLFEMGESGLKEVTDPSGHFLSGEAAPGPGTAVAVAIEGRRPLLLEVQALVGHSGGASAPQRVVSGLDQRRVAILTAVLHNVAGIQLAGRDIYVNIIGGFVTDEPAVDLAAAIAIASAALKKPVAPRSVYIGEVGLAGEIRHVPQLERRLIEAEKIGFRSAIVPPINAREINYAGELDLHPAGRIGQVLADL